ncbi:MAG: hypothetical protein ABIX01_17955 [Chitinophagaceae bacterium]
MEEQLWLLLFLRPAIKTTAPRNNIAYQDGDCFKSLCSGKLILVQKQSDVAGKVYYNSSEPFVSNGTQGNNSD